MTTEQRLDRVETEFATIRQLLISAATYAESANRRIDELGTKQDRTQIMLDELGAKQDRSQTQLDQLGMRVDQLSSRVDEFIFHKTSR